jgi:hypothetical protein
MDSKSNINGYARSGELDANGIEHARPARKPDRLWSIILAGGNGEWNGLLKQSAASGGSQTFL